MLFRRRELNDYQENSATLEFDRQVARSISEFDLWNGNEIGRRVALVGYGMIGNGTWGATTLDGRQHDVRNEVDWTYDVLGYNSNIIGADFTYPFRGTSLDCNLFFGCFVDRILADEGILASGDSGGGLFVYAGGSWKLAGIASFIIDGTFNGYFSDYMDLGGWTRIASYASWIYDCMADGVGAESCTPPTGEMVGSGSRQSLGSSDGARYSLQAPVAFEPANISEPSTILAVLMSSALGAFTYKKRAESGD